MNELPYYLGENFVRAVVLQLSALLSAVGLNIREAHVFSTADGFSLDVFVVDGWDTEVNRVHGCVAQAIPNYDQPRH